MKQVVVRLIVIHLIVLVLAAVGGALLASGIAAAWWSAVTGALCFSVPVVVFSGLVVRASAGDQKRFLGRFMFAELLKWATAAAFLAVSFVTKSFSPLPLLGGFILSVLVQVIFPIFLRKESES